MRKFFKWVGWIVLALLILLTGVACAQPADTYKDPRFCGFVPRDTDGTIKRSQTELKHFQQHNPCPSTGLTTGACPGWAINHSWPIACGGCDAEVNMYWLRDETKSCKEDWCVDRYERKIRWVKGPMPGFIPSACTPQIMLPLTPADPVPAPSGK